MHAPLSSRRGQQLDWPRKVMTGSVGLTRELVQVVCVKVGLDIFSPRVVRPGTDPRQDSEQEQPGRRHGGDRGWQCLCLVCAYVNHTWIHDLYGSPLMLHARSIYGIIGPGICPAVVVLKQNRLSYVTKHAMLYLLCRICASGMLVAHPRYRKIINYVQFS